MTESTIKPAPRRRRLTRWLRRGCGALVAVAWMGAVLWALLAVSYADLHHASPRYVLAGLTLVVALAGAGFALRSRRWPRLRWAAAAAPLLIVLVWYFSLRPSNDRD